MSQGFTASSVAAFFKPPRAPNASKDSLAVLREYSQFRRSYKSFPTTFGKSISFAPLQSESEAPQSFNPQFDEVMPPKNITFRNKVSTPSDKMFKSGHKSKNKRSPQKRPEKPKLENIKEENWADIVAENPQLIKV